VLALTVDGFGPSAANVARLASEAGPAWRVVPLDVDEEGARVVPDQPGSPQQRSA
jgi:hypothetical protein